MKWMRVMMTIYHRQNVCVNWVWKMLLKPVKIHVLLFVNTWIYKTARAHFNLHNKCSNMIESIFILSHSSSLNTPCRHLYRFLNTGATSSGSYFFWPCSKPNYSIPLVAPLLTTATKCPMSSGSGCWIISAYAKSPAIRSCVSEPTCQNTFPSSHPFSTVWKPVYKALKCHLFDCKSINAWYIIAYLF